MSRRMQRFTVTTALTAAALFGALYQTTDAGASDCFNHPDACEAPEGTDHAPVLDRPVQASADVTTCVAWVVCF